ncbi:DNA ligase D [Pseudorhodoferax soli]|uniref:DNA ligase (ATP) n=1 Tax=Pseudorhodoferax soli TaxID=545864 RepID=A0A368Y0C2_9BURK|nr:DNA ligase D [Pseudorhodoferax soli]RCW73731.1 ATP-dependent DNA ligase LigD phosphoesterase module /ATP-dependent DNA ligase LigD polymerase module [Pseudorhodoferax soli]
MAHPSALATYQAKRDFGRTSEPRSGGKRSPAGQPSFVVQKHWASSLHYDFRLEIDGTMKSWAVPKGPSFDPHDKRLAVQVEDHPISYSSFEGEIPEGQYGAGKVIVWDKGHWAPVGDPAAGWRKGNLKFELHGHKLQGRWALVRMHGKGKDRQPPWLLVKEKDAFERPAAEFSVVDEMPDSVMGLQAPAVQETAQPPQATLPATLAPQLATLASQPPADPADWVYEIKFDGYRLLARVEGRGKKQQVQLFTRNGNDWTHKLKALHAELLRLDLPEGWYDGEIVVMDHNGLPDFGALQQAFDASKTQTIVYYLFDVPYCGGHDLREQPLQARRALLASLLEGKDSDLVFYSATFDAPPGQVVGTACKLGLEGVIAKRKDAPYVSRRSDSWLKLKCSQRQEFVVVGTTDPQGTRAGFGALLLGVHDKAGRLVYAGKVGTGFDQATLKKLAGQLAALATPRSPLADTAGVEGKPHWVKPQLVAEVTFGEWTRGGRIRHAVFHGLRADKPAKTIVRERAAPPPKAKPAAKAADESTAHALSTRLKVTHPERVIDPSSGITKLDLVRYYALVGDLMLDQLKGNRPVALVRAPAGMGKQLFFQKHAETEKLPGIRQLDPGLDPGHASLLALASPRGLLSAAQWNVVEFHSMNALAASFDKPDRLVFDLDPGEGVRWRQMQEAAELVHAFLEQLGLPAFLKTSGGKGLHVVVPIKRLHSWASAKGFAQAIVQHLARTIPDRFVAKSGPRNRVGRIFVDYLRNSQGATTVCAWSARARPGMGISVPLAWDELSTLKSSDQWNVRNVHGRLDIGNAPWQGYARAARSLKTAMKTIGFEEG